MFPYLSVLKRAYLITLKYKWLWIFGLFIGGVSNYSNIVASFRSETEYANQGAASFFLLWQQVQDNPVQAGAAMAFIVAAIAFYALFQGLSKSAILYAINELDEIRAGRKTETDINFRSALTNGKSFFSKIVCLQLAIIAAAILLLVTILAPVYFLHNSDIDLYGSFLFPLGSLILLSGAFVLSVIFVLGPVFIVVYGSSVTQAIILSLKLLHKKTWSVLSFGAVLILLDIAWSLAIVTSIAIVAAIAGLGSLNSLLSTLLAAEPSVLEGFNAAGIIILSIYAIVMGTIFSVFSNASWILAAKEMIASLPLGEESKSFSPAPASEPTRG